MARVDALTSMNTNGKALLILTVPVFVVLLVASFLSTPAAVPAFRIVAEQGSILSIVVDEKVAADDAALFKIADSILPVMPGRLVMLQVWTDAGLVPAKLLDMTDAQAAARRATVAINLNTGNRTVDRKAQ